MDVLGRPLLVNFVARFSSREHLEIFNFGNA